MIILKVTDWGSPGNKTVLIPGLPKSYSLEAVS